MRHSSSLSSARFHRRTLLAAALALLAGATIFPLTAPSASAAPSDCDISINGSFESPDIEADPLPGDSYSGGLPSYRTSVGVLDGWTILSGTIDLLRYWTNASDGFQSLDMWGTAPSTLQQTFGGLTPGASYTFAIDYSGMSTTQSTGVVALDLGSGLNDLTTLAPVAAGGPGAGPFAQTVTWATYTHTFVATGSTATIRITNQVAPGPINTGLFVDNFRLSRSICQDFGDAPSSYGTSLAGNGAAHGVDDIDSATNTAPLMLGASVDVADSDGVPSAGATADDATGVDDEDGVVAAIVATSGAPTDVSVSVTNTAGSPATLAGWLDLDDNGTFDLGERVTLGIPANSGTAAHVLSFPAGALTSGTSYARFRLFSGTVPTPSAVGAVIGGEVEDYEIAFAPVPAAGLTLVKSASPADAASYVVDQVITYSFVVTNTGNVPVTGVAVTESGFSGTGTAPVPSCPATDLAVGEQMICTAGYTLTQPDIDASSVTNAAIADGTTNLGTVASAPSSVTIPGSPTSAIGLIKTASPTEVDAVGDVITYSFDVTNTGTVTLQAISIVEDAFSGSGSLPAPSCPAAAASLTPGQTVTCTTQYAVTQADLDAGQIANTATASADPPSGAIVTSAPSAATVDVVTAPALAMVKTASASSVPGEGQQITYTFAVTNTGNVTLSGIVVDEISFTGSGTLSAIDCPVQTVAPAATIACTATYTTTSADAAAGVLTNIAGASGTPPAGGQIDSLPDDATVVVSAALAATGATAPVLPWALAILGLVAGALLMTSGVIRRTRAG